LASEIRPTVGALDIGAYEFGREWVFADDFETGDYEAWSRTSP
jgi:hypothetical protein